MKGNKMLAAEDRANFLKVVNGIADLFEKAFDERIDRIVLCDSTMKLTPAERGAFVRAIDDGADIGSLGHDLNGLSRRETCFLPRIKVIADAMREEE